MKKIYVCGPTVYSDVHIGNMRPIITFDIFNRSLKALNEEFIFIHNITDIDDKIIIKAQEENKKESDISSKYEDLYLGLLEQANVLKPDYLPKVTDNIFGIIDYIKKLIKKGKAYEKNGNVYFDVKSVSGYGNISNRNIDSMKFENSKNKKHPSDFALWKNTNTGITFDSPWGKGRPGWHTECSYFISKLANGSLDIHGGGVDLLFPHHENENIQNKAIFNKDITKEWRHVGHVNLDNEKMSKSLGNVFLAKDFFKDFGADVLRYIFITSSYSAPINLTETLIKQSVNQIDRMNKIFLQTQLFNIRKIDIQAEAKLISEWKFSEFNKKLSEAIKSFNIENNDENASIVYNLLKLVGFKFTDYQLSSENKCLYKEWIDARNSKDFEKADKLRGSLQRKNIL